MARVTNTKHKRCKRTTNTSCVIYIGSKKRDWRVVLICVRHSAKPAVAPTGITTESLDVCLQHCWDIHRPSVQRLLCSLSSAEKKR